MLCLTRESGYGLTALAYLAETPGRFVCARQIAERLGASTALVMKVLKRLAAAGRVASARGADGGYRLACDPAEVAMVDLIDDLEGPIRDSDCLRGRTRGDRDCEHIADCEFADPVHRLHRMLRDFLRNLTLAEIMGLGAGQGAASVAAPARPRDAGSE